jgi:hypothetical protein
MTKGTRTGANARSGPSGPSTPHHARARKKVEVTLSDEARAVLLAESARTEEPRSLLVEALVVSHLAQERYLPPALLGRAQALATRRGGNLWTVLSEAALRGLQGLELSEFLADPPSRLSAPVPFGEQIPGKLVPGLCHQRRDLPHG